MVIYDKNYNRDTNKYEYTFLLPNVPVLPKSVLIHLTDYRGVRRTAYFLDLMYVNSENPNQMSNINGNLGEATIDYKTGLVSIILEYYQHSFYVEYSTDELPTPIRHKERAISHTIGSGINKLTSTASNLTYIQERIQNQLSTPDDNGNYVVDELSKVGILKLLSNNTTNIIRNPIANNLILSIMRKMSLPKLCKYNLLTIVRDNRELPLCSYYVLLGKDIMYSRRQYKSFLSESTFMGLTTNINLSADIDKLIEYFSEDKLSSEVVIEVREGVNFNNIYKVIVDGVEKG